MVQPVCGSIRVDTLMQGLELSEEAGTTQYSIKPLPVAVQQV